MSVERLFIDECLSASLVAAAKDRGFAADFGPHIGMAGWQDWNIAKFALENDYIVVTNNRRHFLREYVKYPLHAGLIIIVPHVDRHAQNILFGLALDHLESHGPMLNILLEIHEDGKRSVRPWHASDHDISYIANPDRGRTPGT